MREITEGLYQVPAGQIFLASGDYNGDCGQFFNGQAVVVPHTVTSPASAVVGLINRDAGSIVLSPLPGGCCTPPPAPPANPIYGVTPDNRAWGVELWCIGNYSSDYFQSPRDGEYVAKLYEDPGVDEMIGVMQRDGALLGVSPCGIGIVDPPGGGPVTDTCYEISTFPPGTATTSTSLVGADCRTYSVLGVVQAGETTTTLAYNAGTNQLTFTDEDGGVTIIDLSALAPDVNVANVSYNPATGILTITETDGSVYNVNVGSSPVSAVMSITGDGTPGNPIALAGDAAAPGSGYFYGTSPVGVKGWYSFSPTVAYNSGTGQLTVTVGGIASAPLTLAGDLVEDSFGVDLGYFLPL